MKQYIAKTNTSVFPFGLIAKGETLKPEHVKALGAETVEDMVRRGTLEAVNGGESRTGEEEKPQAEKPEGVAQIGIESFMGVELRTAQVVACEKVPNAKKLLCLQLDLGYEKRQVLSGIAKFYQPEDLIGRKVIVVANLKPAVLCGMESNGMILASGEETVRVVFLSDDTPLGERVR